MNEMQVFNNPEFGDIRTVTVNEEPWFVLKDVCEAFGETNYRRVAGHLEDDEKGVSQKACRKLHIPIEELRAAITL